MLTHYVREYLPYDLMPKKNLPYASRYVDWKKLQIDL